MGTPVPLHPPLPSPQALRRRAALGDLGRRLRDGGGRLRDRLPRDARVWQIVFLASLLGFGVLARDFSLSAEQFAGAVTAAVLTQAFWLHRLRLAHKGYLSAIVTSFGLSILLRADAAWVHPVAACLAISSKFLVRVRGKHVFNPANLGVIAGLALLPGTWVSPGQWGNDLAAAVAFVALGGIVTDRARRGDIALAFLASWLGLCALRVLWLGQSWAVWTHQLGNGALLLFAFFMISDPMTTPDRRAVRIGYALFVALLAFAWQYGLFRPNALPIALFVATPLVPLLDRRWPGPRFAWNAAAIGRGTATGRGAA